MVVRRIAHTLGYRFRLHRRDLPGSPDLVFSRRKMAVFVHGCFWHRHPGCSRATTPKTRTEFWVGKFKRNVERDAEVERSLRAQGWDVLTVWECETRNADRLSETLKAFLGPPGPTVSPEAPSPVRDRCDG
jgi:DNA mismatch endonuclease (patch repair protein)